MKITHITVGCIETCNLGDYSNTKPSIELTAQLDATDDPAAVLDELIGLAKARIREEVDKELIAVGKPPKYYAGPRFAYITSSRYKFNAIVPQGMHRHPHTYYPLANTTLDAVVAEANAQLIEEGYIFFDCSNGDLSRLLAHIEEREEERRRYEEKRRFAQEYPSRITESAESAEGDDDDGEEEDNEEEDDEH